MFFTGLKLSFNNESNQLKEEISTIENVFENISRVNNLVENISAISEEHTAANQEVLASVETQNLDMKTMLSGVENIERKWNELKNMLSDKSRVIASDINSCHEDHINQRPTVRSFV